MTHVKLSSELGTCAVEHSELPGCGGSLELPSWRCRGPARARLMLVGVLACDRRQHGGLTAGAQALGILHFPRSRLLGIYGSLIDGLFTSKLPLGSSIKVHVKAKVSAHFRLASCTPW